MANSAKRSIEVAKLDRRNAINKFICNVFAGEKERREKERGRGKEMLESGGEMHPLAWLFIEPNDRPVIICKMQNENGKTNSVIMDEA